MPLESGSRADFQVRLDEHGAGARWKTIDLRVLVSRIRGDLQIDMGGFVESPDLSQRLAKASFPTALPKFGDRIVVAGAAPQENIQSPAFVPHHPQTHFQR
jgi:hypothetical protein